MFGEAESPMVCIGFEHHQNLDQKKSPRVWKIKNITLKYPTIPRFILAWKTISPFLMAIYWGITHFETDLYTVCWGKLKDKRAGSVPILDIQLSPTAYIPNLPPLEQPI